VLDDLIVYFLGNECFRVVVNAATAEKDVAWLRSLLAECSPAPGLRERRDLSIIAVQGPEARERVWQAMPELRQATGNLAEFCAATVDDALVARTGYTGEDGFELMLPSSRSGSAWEAMLGAGVRPAGLGARDTLRLEAGMCLYGQDMDDTVTPFECRLHWTVDLSGSRDFVGRQALVTSSATRNLFGVVLLDRGVLRTHQQVHTSHGPGEITSGTYSPTLQMSIGLARLPVPVQPDEMIKVKIRDKWLSARTVRYPFVRHGRSLLADQVAGR
jgi:aminomethyltransferase